MARRDGMAARRDRPRERRCADIWHGREDWTAHRTPGLRSTLTVREGTSSAGPTIDFVGCATAYGTVYEMYDFWGPYGEEVEAGAGALSLNRADLAVPLVIQHDQSRRIAATWVTDTHGQLNLVESDTGLQVDAPDLDPADVDVAGVVPKLRAGLLNEMSFAFRIDIGVWSPDFMQFNIQQYDIHRGDVAIVGFGANPATSADLRAKDKQGQREALRRRRLLLDIELAR
jgi:HK97 family phage prohead protease